MVTAGGASIANTEAASTTATLTSSATVRGYIEEWHGIELLHSGVNNGRESSIAVSGNSIYLAYTEAGTSRLYFIYSNDRGKTWSTPQAIVNNYSRPPSPTIKVTSSKILISYLYDPDSSSTTYIRLATKGLTGTIWSHLTVATNSLYPTMAVDSDASAIHICHGGAGGLKVSSSTNSGSTWSHNTLSTTPYPIQTEI